MQSLIQISIGANFLIAAAFVPTNPKPNQDAMFEVKVRPTFAECRCECRSGEKTKGCLWQETQGTS